MTSYTKKQQRENRVKLATALMSGMYEQGRGQLRIHKSDKKDDFKHCCLGVACDISGLGEWEDIRYHINGKDRTKGILHEEVKEYYGFDNTDGRLNGVVLWEKNDGFQSKHWSFLEIAEEILKAE